MRWTLLAASPAVMLALGGCTDGTRASAPPTLSPTVAVWQMHTPYGAGPASYPTSIYDPSLLNDTSMLEDQPHNRGNKGGNTPTMDATHR